MAFTIQTNKAATIGAVVDLQQAIISGLAADDDVEIDCSLVVEADLSFLQLVSAARDQAHRDSKRLTLARPANATITTLLKRAGFVDGFDQADIDFWFHGDFPQ